MADAKLKPCPFCGGNDLELKDCTDTMYGFWDYKIVCHTCRAYMNSPPTGHIIPIENGFRQIRDAETKAKAKRELVIAWNRREDNNAAD